MIDAKEEQVRILAKQLKLPTVANFMDVIRQCRPDADFSDLLIELLNAEINSRRENQNIRRQKAAGFPYVKTLDDLIRHLILLRSIFTVLSVKFWLR